MPEKVIALPFSSMRFWVILFAVYGTQIAFRRASSKNGEGLRLGHPATFLKALFCLPPIREVS